MDTSTPASAEAHKAALAALATTRQRMHGIGECLMAGPQRRAGGRFTLRVTPGGFATTGAPPLRLDGNEIVVDESRRVAITGTFAELAEALGVDFGPPPDAYPDGSKVSPADDVTLDALAARHLQDWYLLADAALRVMAPRQTPILWPEHFDVAILLDDSSFGVSPGDGFHATPYAYVSSQNHGDSQQLESQFWNAPFGALRGHNQMHSVDDLVTFWRTAQSLLTSER